VIDHLFPRPVCEESRAGRVVSGGRGGRLRDAVPQEADAHALSTLGKLDERIVPSHGPFRHIVMRRRHSRRHDGGVGKFSESFQDFFEG
jgi:hypothetical protein